MEARDYVIALLGAGMTQAQIAEKTGMGQPTVSKVYRGEVADVLSRNYRRLQELHAEVVGDQKAPSEAAQA
ncbi:helix-turn-helix domain-containing protein [Roseateles depolymerans]|uniref:Transcriptional regulator n=1 Tax=Roseateles depolymerans TaxID=76731 RepID=A0A0U3LJT9_9BURK|nr:helix-turn-helix domain-containing protein [Roseateles depolymerans]ALV06674.1 transcriptional regulator [Roseateles depolymerans]REG19651.1 helix-turn-helix protein [Roseateles depolymerans]